MLLPGPEAQQLAVYIGWLLHGTKGGLRCRVAVHPAGLRLDPGAELRLCRLRRCRADRRPVLRPEGRGARHRAARRPADRQARAAELGDGVDRRRRLRRHLLLPRALPGHHPGGSADRLCRQAVPARRCSGSAAAMRAASMKAFSDAESALGEAIPDHARPNLGWSLRISAVFLVLWLGAGRAALRPARPRQRVQPDRRRSSARWRSSPSAAPMPCSPRSPRRRWSIMVGCGPARCSTGSAWRRRRRAR